MVWEINVTFNVREGDIFKDEILGGERRQGTVIPKLKMS
jgi:hypothetical protein